MILVTGATGLLGTRLLFDLTSSGERVRALKRENSRMSRFENMFKNHPALTSQVEWVNADILDLYSLSEALEGAERVYHCAAKVSFQPSDHRMMHQVNIAGTANLVNLCLDKGVKKLVHVSSVAAMGRINDGMIITENNVWKTSKSNSEYAVSKYGSEREIWRGIAEGLDAVIVNPGIIIGPGNWKTDSSMIFRQIWKGLKFYTPGINGFVDVRDVSRAMISLMNENITGERFILVAENKPYRQVFDQIADRVGKKRAGIYAGPLLSAIAWRSEALRSMITGSKPVITKETARSASGKYYYDNKKIKEFLNFEFLPVERSINDTAEIFLEEQKVNAH